jgi:hypothetical protein
MQIAETPGFFLLAILYRFGIILKCNYTIKLLLGSDIVSIWLYLDSELFTFGIICA